MDAIVVPSQFSTRLIDASTHLKLTVCLPVCMSIVHFKWTADCKQNNLFEQNTSERRDKDRIAVIDLPVMISVCCRLFVGILQVSVVRDPHLEFTDDYAISTQFPRFQK